MRAQIWWAIISFNFYDIIIRGKMSQAQQREKVYNVVGWVVPAGFLIVAILSGALEEKRAYGIWECFLKKKNGAWPYVLFYGWLGAVCVAALFVWPRCLYEVYQVRVYHTGSKAKVSRRRGWGGVV